MAALPPTSMLRLATMLMGQPAPQQQSPSPFSVPFTGLRNDRNPLPAFEPPGSSLPIQNYMPQQLPAAVTMPPVTVAASPPPPDPAPEVPAMGGQGWGGPEPAPGTVRSDVMTALRLMAQQGKLPEQWRGAFGNQYGEPT